MEMALNRYTAADINTEKPSQQGGMTLQNTILQAPTGNIEGGVFSTF